MNREDAIRLCRYVAAACPQQKFDDYTPNVWADILEDVDLTLDEGRQAVVAIKHRQPFVDTSEIIAEVKRARAERLARTPLPAPPADLADSPGRYKAAIQMGVRRIAEGFSVARAIEGGPLEGDPPAEWTKAKEALTQPPPDVPTPQELAAEQAAASRAERERAEQPGREAS